MKLTLVFLAVALAVASARPQNANAEVRVVNEESENLGEGSYNFKYELSDGTSRQEQGQLKNAGSEDEAQEVTGEIKFQTPEGKTVTINFISDEKGYRPKISIS